MAGLAAARQQSFSQGAGGVPGRPGTPGAGTAAQTAPVPGQAFGTPVRPGPSPPASAGASAPPGGIGPPIVVPPGVGASAFQRQSYPQPAASQAAAAPPSSTADFFASAGPGAFQQSQQSLQPQTFTAGRPVSAQLQPVGVQSPAAANPGAARMLPPTQYKTLPEYVDGLLSGPVLWRSGTKSGAGSPQSQDGTESIDPLVSPAAPAGGPLKQLLFFGNATAPPPVNVASTTPAALQSTPDAGHLVEAALSAAHERQWAAVLTLVPKAVEQRAALVARSAETTTQQLQEPHSPASNPSLPALSASQLAHLCVCQRTRVSALVATRQHVTALQDIANVLIALADAAVDLPIHGDRGAMTRSSLLTGIASWLVLHATALHAAGFWREATSELHGLMRFLDATSDAKAAELAMEPRLSPAASWLAPLLAAGEAQPPSVAMHRHSHSQHAHPHHPHAHGNTSNRSHASAPLSPAAAGGASATTSAPAPASTHASRQDVANGVGHHDEHKRADKDGDNMPTVVDRSMHALAQAGVAALSPNDRWRLYGAAAIACAHVLVTAGCATAADDIFRAAIDVLESACTPQHQQGLGVGEADAAPAAGCRNVDEALRGAPAQLWHGIVASQYVRYLCVRGREADCTAALARGRAAPLWAAASAGAAAAAADGSGSDTPVSYRNLLHAYAACVSSLDDGILSLIHQQPAAAVGKFEAAAMAAVALARAGSGSCSDSGSTAGRARAPSFPEESTVAVDAFALSETQAWPIPVIPSGTMLLLEAATTCAVACFRSGAGANGVALLEALVRTDPARHVSSADVPVTLAALYDATRDAMSAALGKRVLQGVAVKYGLRHLNPPVFRLST